MVRRNLGRACRRLARSYSSERHDGGEDADDEVGSFRSDDELNGEQRAGDDSPSSRPPAEGGDEREQDGGHDEEAHLGRPEDRSDQPGIARADSHKEASDDQDRPRPPGEADPQPPRRHGAERKQKHLLPSDARPSRIPEHLQPDQRLDIVQEQAVDSEAALPWPLIESQRRHGGQRLTLVKRVHGPDFAGSAAVNKNTSTPPDTERTDVRSSLKMRPVGSLVDHCDRSTMNW